MTEAEVRQLNPVTLAFVGDAEFTLYVRRRLVEDHDYKTSEITRRCNKTVSAVAQSAMFEAIASTLTDAETEIARRGRNAHTPAHAKNAGLSDYKRATALEAVFGYLALSGQDERLRQLMSMCFAAAEGER